MSQSGILDALGNEERSLKSQLVAIQRAIEANRGKRPAGRRARQEEGGQGGRQAEARDERRAAQGRRRADAQVLGIPAGSQGAGGRGAGVRRRARLADSLGVRPSDCRCRLPGVRPRRGAVPAGGRRRRPRLHAVPRAPDPLHEEHEQVVTW